MSDATRYIKSPRGILKLAEIVTVLLAVLICRISHIHFSFNPNVSYFGVGVMVTCLIVTPLLLICYLMGKLEIQKTIFEPVYNTLMAVLLITVGAMTVSHWMEIAGNRTIKKAVEAVKDIKTIVETPEMVLATGSFCVIASGEYLADAVLAILAYRK